MIRWCTLAVFALLAVSAGSDEALHVRAIQHAGWWEIRYPDGTIAANELHVPAGQSVTVDATLDGAGLLWFDDGHLPRLGRSASVTFRAARGQRAIAHSLHVREPRRSDLLVVADERFDAWLARQRDAAPMPASAEAAEGRAVFLTARCTVCHTVRGVAAAEQPVGPDLTHVASRGTLAAGALPNNAGFLSGWVVDAEAMKPGAGMPVNNIDSEKLQALLAYLRSLQ